MICSLSNSKLSKIFSSFISTFGSILEGIKVERSELTCVDYVTLAMQKVECK